jgi:hypothetical protein
VRVLGSRCEQRHFELKKCTVGLSLILGHRQIWSARKRLFLRRKERPIISKVLCYLQHLAHEYFILVLTSGKVKLPEAHLNTVAKF